MTEIAWLIVGGTVLLLLFVVSVMHLRLRQATETERERLQAEAEAARKAAEEHAGEAASALRKANWYRRILDHSPDIGLTYSLTEDQVPDGFLEINDAACEALEYTREQLQSMSPLDVETVRQPEAAEQKGDVHFATLTNRESLGRESTVAVRHMQVLARRILREGSLHYEGSYVTEKGHLIPVEIMAFAVEENGEQKIATFAHDLTKSHRLEAELQESETRLRELTSHSSLGIARYDGQKRLTAANAVFLKFLGCPDEGEAERFNMLDSDLIPSTAKEQINTGEFCRCTMCIDFDGILKEGTFVTSRQGIAYMDMSVTNLGVNRDYSPRGYLVQLRDVTMEHETDLAMRQMERQLRQAQKMEAIGTLAGGIAHDFNNMLTPILGYSEMGEEIAQEGSELKDFFREILTSSRRAKQLVEQILIFSRRGERATVPINLTTIVKEVAKQMTASLPDTIEVRCNIRTEQDRVLATPTQVHQVLMNLCSNAGYVMRKTGGALEIGLSTFVLGHRHKSEFPQLATTAYLRSSERTPYVRITVRDTGPGMDPDTVDRIFEPFFTTKPRGEGTGMGLPLVQSIATSLNGCISVDSRPGEGTTFHVVIPLIPSEEPQEAEITGGATVETAKACILFVDDEKAIVRMAERMLVSLGYTCVVTNESPKALQIFQRDPYRFDLVITDHVMPELTGEELTKQLLDIRPSLPVIVCSGFSEKFSPERAKAVGVSEFVMKPMERRDLAVAIERALSGRATQFPPPTVPETSSSE